MLSKIIQSSVVATAITTVENTMIVDRFDIA
jgi:hypothetical protein